MTIWKRLLCPLLWAATALCVAKDCSNRISMVGVEGEDIVLAPSVSGNGRLTRIYWKKGEDILIGSRFNITSEKEKQRWSFDSSSGNLSLKNLSKEDIGTYTAKVIIKEEIKETCFDLKILVRPDINCTVNNDTIQLNCTSASQDLPLAYSWDVNRNEENISEKNSVIQLQRNSNHFQKITCYVGASNSIASNFINLSDCIIPVKEPDHQSRSRIPLIAIAIIPVLMIVYYCIMKYLKARRKGSFNESESAAKNARGNYKEETSRLES